MKHLVAHLVVLLVASSCVDPPEPPITVYDPPIPDGTPRFPDAGLLAFGLGTSGDWAPLGSSASLERGPQGGYHLPFKYRVSAPVGDELFVIRRVRRVSDGQVVGRSQATLTLQGAPGVMGARETPPTVVFLCPVRRGAGVLQVPLVLESYGFAYDQVRGEPGERLLESKTEFQLRCSDCEASCGGGG